VRPLVDHDAAERPLLLGAASGGRTSGCRRPPGPRCCASPCRTRSLPAAFLLLGFGAASPLGSGGQTHYPLYSLVSQREMRWGAGKILPEGRGVKGPRGGLAEVADRGTGQVHVSDSEAEGREVRDVRGRAGVAVLALLLAEVSHCQVRPAEL
jgi:hypothetical protein